MNAKLPLFFAPELAGAQSAYTLDDASARHALQVLRMVPGQPLLLTNGQGLVAEATLMAGAGGGKKTCAAALRQMSQYPHPVLRHVAIAISPVKNAGRFEWFVEKATELGVAQIFPLLCKRTVAAHFKLERIKSICTSAMLQSQQAWMPRLHQPVPLAQVLSQPFDRRLMAHCLPGAKQSLGSLVPTLGPKSVLLLIGPEGDFTADEIELALAAGFAPCGLGSTRLRTETAGVAGASLLCLT
jgi:16S rRNA (uracil1498-N3)-methyltransferase